MKNSSIKRGPLAIGLGSATSGIAADKSYWRYYL